MADDSATGRKGPISVLLETIAYLVEETAADAREAEAAAQGGDGAQPLGDGASPIGVDSTPLATDSAQGLISDIRAAFDRLDGQIELEFAKLENVRRGAQAIAGVAQTIQQMVEARRGRVLRGEVPLTPVQPAGSVNAEFCARVMTCVQAASLLHRGAKVPTVGRTPSRGR